MLPTAQPAPAMDASVNTEVKVEPTGVVKQFEDLIETVISTIQEPEVTEAGVAAVMARLQAYSDGINRLVETLPPEAANGNEGGVGVGRAGV
ncbi:unnamed protein product [Ectocarpus sp. 8 AP-2014]